MSTRKGYGRGRLCADCHQPITDYAIRCVSCQNRFRVGKPRPRRTIWTEEKIIDALVRFADLHDGRAPVRTECSDTDFLPDQTTIKRRFGSYAAAVQAAGLTGGEPGVNVRSSSARPTVGNAGRRRQTTTAGGHPVRGATTYNGKPRW